MRQRLTDLGLTGSLSRKRRTARGLTEEEKDKETGFDFNFVEIILDFSNMGSNIRSSLRFASEEDDVDESSSSQESDSSSSSSSSSNGIAPIEKVKECLVNENYAIRKQPNPRVDRLDDWGYNFNIDDSEVVRFILNLEEDSATSHSFVMNMKPYADEWIKKGWEFKQKDGKKLVSDVYSKFYLEENGNVGVIIISFHVPHYPFSPGKKP